MLRERAAYAAALTYLNAGAALLAEDSWDRQRELIFALELNRAECEYLTGQLPAAEARLAALPDRTAGLAERASVACLRTDVCTALGQSGRAIEVCLSCLRHAGIEWPAHPSAGDLRREYERIGSLLGNRTAEHLIDLPTMENPEILATVEVLIKLWPAGLFTEANLASLTICKAVSLSLEHGNCDASCFAYVLLGRIAGPVFGDYQAGFRYGRLGYELVAQRGLKRFEARTYLCFANSVVPWMKHVRACRDLERRAFQAANRAGDLIYGGFACNSLNTSLLFAGEPLPQVQDEAGQGFAFAAKAGFGLVIDSIAAQLALIRTLRGLTPEIGRFDGGQYGELQTEAHFASNPALAIAACRYWIRKLQARYFAGDYAAAIGAASKAQQLLWTAPLAFEEADYHFYGALARAAYYGSAPEGERQQHLDALVAHHRQLQLWAANCPENFENRAALAGAEIARLEGRMPMHAPLRKGYRSARTHGFVHNQAIAHEADGTLLSRLAGSRRPALRISRRARACYALWGADGKVRQLDQLLSATGCAGRACIWSAGSSPAARQPDVAAVAKRPRGPFRARSSCRS